MFYVKPGEHPRGVWRTIARMLTGIIGVVLAMLLLVNGFAALRRPFEQLIENDPLGKRLLASRGEAFTRRAYRVYGAIFVLLGLAVAYLAVGNLRG